MKKIKRENSIVVCNDGSWAFVNAHISSSDYSKIFLIVDTETEKYCLPLLEAKLTLSNFEIISIPDGESYKTIETCLYVWEQLSKKGADRKSLVLNLGGGVVTDLGGFVASTYQRGIAFINIPTSLLAMVDASVGGKNGVDLGSLKNQVGVIKDPKMVIVATLFLKTLPKLHVISGMAEMIKHGLIASEKYLENTWDFNIENTSEVEALIWESIEIKNTIVTQDPTEKGLRKTLNYGHTMGHAIESYFLEHPKKSALLHGEAIAIGLILETYISSQILGFPEKKLKNISEKLLSIFPKTTFSEEDINKIIKLLIFDKKNTHGVVQFVLLEDIGKTKVNCIVSNDIIKDAFKFYKNYLEK